MKGWKKKAQADRNHNRSSKKYPEILAGYLSQRTERSELMNASRITIKDVGIKNACDALVIPRASFYRWYDRDKHSTKNNCRPVPPLSLTGKERVRGA
ncbi:MAG: hypothetical protein SRB1_00409 [Desulfobacteraceae bacterium Eth-SRB1]|nr:MAG: hypothetical protein SRB1_00409 [Desulfobacteraceae bacterium Eth-SRB1]